MNPSLADMAAAANTKRDPEPDKPVNVSGAIAADAQRREAERLNRRKAVREQIRERGVLMQELSDIETQLKMLDAKADTAAAEHATKTAPIQSKLATATGDARTKLLTQLGEANITLETALQVIDRVRGPLRKQWSDTRSKLAGLLTEQRLAGDDLSSPALRVERFVAQKRLAVVQARIESARGRLDEYQPVLRNAKGTAVPESSHGWGRVGGQTNLDFQLIATLTQRIEQWRAELLDAEAEQHDVMTESNEITVRMIAE